jgi:hypothetical protein
MNKNELLRIMKRYNEFDKEYKNDPEHFPEWKFEELGKLELEIKYGMFSLWKKGEIIIS